MTINELKKFKKYIDEIEQILLKVKHGNCKYDILLDWNAIKIGFSGDKKRLLFKYSYDKQLEIELTKWKENGDRIEEKLSTNQDLVELINDFHNGGLK